MVNYFGESVNTVVLPEYGKEAVLKSIRQSEYLKEDNQIAERNTALDFYYNRNLDTHIDEWFKGSKHLRQVPSFPIAIVPRFARARMLLYKKPPLRLLNGEESDEYTPGEIQQTAIESIESGRHHYTSALGDERLRHSIAERHQLRTGQRVSADNVCVFSGAQNALFATSLCLLEHGTEVIVPELYYATYPASVKLGGATMIPLPTDVSNGFQIDIDALEKAITPRTRAILLNSPNNPTGAVYSRKLLMRIVELCRKNSIWIISDEVGNPSFLQQGYKIELSDL